jgi:hypothetical protein
MLDGILPALTLTMAMVPVVAMYRMNSSRVCGLLLHDRR